jgi:hypothetical protein
VVVRLADDRRGRVPFAVVGVLLLVGASTFAVTLETTGPSRADRSADVAIERVSTSSATALREAVREAAHEAALAPVTAPANTSAGSVIDERTAFEDALRLRIYVRARSYLRATSHERGDVRATASLQPTPNAAALEDALSRVRVESVDNGTALDVTVRNVSVRATRGGRTLVSENRTLNVTVATPVAAMHARAEEYERRLNRGPLSGSGLGRQLTARLFAVAWARGYAQHAGAPIGEVLATRHVEVATNDAVLRSQSATFGKTDPAARRGLALAAGRAGVADLTAATPVGAETGAWMWDTAESAAVNVSNDTVRVPSPAESIPVSVGGTADRTLVRVSRGSAAENHTLEGALRESHRTAAALRADVDRIESEERPDVTSPGAGWSRVDESQRVTESVENASGTAPRPRSDERLVAQFVRRVEREHTLTTTWEKGNRTETTESEWTETYRVGVTLIVAHTPNGGAPEGPTRPLFERGGALNGSNLADTPEAASERLVASQGGRDDVAVGLVAGNARTTASVYGERPANLSAWVRRDLATLRQRVRAVSTNVSGTGVGTMRVNPAAILADRLRDRRAELVNAPAAYDGVADRARVAARARYVDAVVARLDSRASDFERMRRAYNRSLAAEGVGSLRSLATQVDVSRNASAAGPSVVRGNLTNATLAPSGSPAYLTAASVNHGDERAVPSGRRYNPLATRNVNLFTVPYEDLAGAVSGAAVDDPERVHLGTAGRTLAAANATLRRRPNETLRTRRELLEEAVRDALSPVEKRAVTTLERTTALPPAARRRAVDEAGERWTLAGRARAAANGTLADAVAAEIAAREGLNDSTRAELAGRLGVATADAVTGRAATVAPERVDETASTARILASKAIRRGISRGGAAATERAAESWVSKAFSAVPAGLPVLPPPYTWYATVNVWTVEVEGAYARFSIRTRRDAPGGSLRYVRDGSTVTLDVDGDGAAERVGRNERVEFSTETAVFVVVPANGRGVGDVGTASETSAGWPGPGCTAPLGDPCPRE